MRQDRRDLCFQTVEAGLVQAVTASVRSRRPGAHPRKPGRKARSSDRSRPAAAKNTGKPSAGDRLRDEYRWLAALLDGLPLIVCVHGADYSIRLANRRFREVFGEALGQPCFRTIAGRDRPCCACPAADVLRSNSAIESEKIFPNGRIYRIVHYPFVQRDGSRVVIEVGIDITEQREINLALHAERSNFKKILDSMPQGVCIINRDCDVEYINPSLERDFGPVGGRKCHAYFHDLPHPCARCRNEEVFSGRSILWEWYSPKTDRTYELFDSPVLTRDGTVGKLEIFHDITSYKKTEHDLSQKEKLLRRVLDAMPVGVWITDREGAIVEMNPEARRIWSGDGDDPIRIQQDPRYEPWWAETRRRIGAEPGAAGRALQTGESVIGEETDITCFDGSRRSILVSAVPFQDCSRMLGAVVVNQDISDRKLAEADRARQQRRLEALWKVSQSSNDDPLQWQEEILREILAMTGSRYGFYGALTEDGEALAVQAWSMETLADCRVAIRPERFAMPGAGLWSEALRSRNPVMVNDYASCPEKRGLPEGHIPLHRFMAVPVLSGSRVIALAGVANKESDYTQEDVEQMKAFLAGVHAAVERKKAEDALRDSEHQLRVLSRRLLTVHETERARISAELHDDLGQALTLLKLRVGLLEERLKADQAPLREECETLLVYMDQVIDRLRHLCHDLSPRMLGDLGLVAGLRRLVHDFSRASGVQVSDDMDCVDDLLPKTLHIQMYRIVQEALTNIARHSGARKVFFSLKAEPRNIRCEITDDGSGLQSAGASGDSGLGLATMKERARMLGGSLEIAGEEGRGTTLRITVPRTRNGNGKVPRRACR